MSAAPCTPAALCIDSVCTVLPCAPWSAVPQAAHSWCDPARADGDAGPSGGSVPAPPAVISPHPEAARADPLVQDAGLRGMLLGAAVLLPGGGLQLQLPVPCLDREGGQQPPQPGAGELWTALALPAHPRGPDVQVLHLRGAGELQQDSVQLLADQCCPVLRRVPAFGHQLPAGNHHHLPAPRALREKDLHPGRIHADSRSVHHGFRTSGLSFWSELCYRERVL